MGSKFIATTAGISGHMVQDLMPECVEKRFGALKTPHPVEWLSDNGSCYTAKETVAFTSMLGLLSRFTPVRSPESNGMAEAFVNTFKRDSVRVQDRPDVATVLSQLPGWFEDYNERHPHKGLRMKSPSDPTPYMLLKSPQLTKAFEDRQKAKAQAAEASKREFEENMKKIERSQKSIKL